MLCGLIEGLIIAWILVEFNIDNICINVIQPFINYKLTTNHFYFVLGFIGLISGFIYEIKK